MADGTFIKTMNAVTSFGEVAMLGLEPKRTATIVAKTHCKLLCLANKDMVVAFRSIISYSLHVMGADFFCTACHRPYPEVMQHIIDGARQKYDKLKENEKSFSSIPG